MERGVADLAGGAGGAAQQLSVDDQPRTDAGRDLYVDEVRALAAGAPGELGKGAEVSVVLDLDRHVQAVVHLAADAHADPARQDGRRPGRASRPVQRSGDSDPPADPRLSPPAPLAHHPATPP